MNKSLTVFFLFLFAAPSMGLSKVKIKIVEDVSDVLYGPDGEGNTIYEGMMEAYQGKDSLWFSLVGGDPDKTDAAKEGVRKEWDVKMKMLRELAKSGMTTIGLHIGEGIFLKKSDGYSTTVGPYSCCGKARKLNLKRFIEYYKNSLDAFFANRKGTILISQWNW